MPDWIHILLSCSTDNCLYNLQQSILVARRMARNSDSQKAYAELQQLIKVELNNRRMADEE